MIVWRIREKEEKYYYEPLLCTIYARSVFADKLGLVGLCLFLVFMCVFLLTIELVCVRLF